MDGEQQDDNFIEMIHRSNLEPTKKFAYPQTTSQEIGWITTPLVNTQKFSLQVLFTYLKF